MSPKLKLAPDESRQQLADATGLTSKLSEDFASGEKSRLPTVSIPAVDDDDRMNRVNMAFD